MGMHGTVAGYCPMLLRPGESIILLADSSAQRLEELERKLDGQGLEAMCAQSPAECLEMTANYRPLAVVLDSDFLQVDQENIPEFINRISRSTMIVLTVEDVASWQDKAPRYVHAVCARGDLDSVISLLRQTI
jgi:DNA-binding NtrC family response regulator